MSRADELYKQTCRKILEEGFSDAELDVRPKWADGTPAHTIKTFGVVNRTVRLFEDLVLDIILHLRIFLTSL
ncbi:MAG: hypothetical protein IIV45_04865 [Lachnospiraceae bacterium]|nr:hypothetical protein [Lachnospiraceae bacterium]